MNSQLHLASHGVSKGGEDKRFWSGAGMSWDSRDSHGSPRKKGNVCAVRHCFLGHLPCWAVPPAIWPSALLALDFICGKIQQGQKVNEKPLPV